MTKSTVVHHWGIWVDSETPITGVQGVNHLPDAYWDDTLNAVDLTCEQCADNGECDSSCDVSHDLLVGDWKQDNNGQWEPDKNAGSHGYAAINRESVIQVVWSKHTQRAALCSPCYPGQADLDSPGEYLAYCLPPDYFTL